MTYRRSPGLILLFPTSLFVLGCLHTYILDFILSEIPRVARKPLSIFENIANIAQQVYYLPLRLSTLLY